MDEDDLTPEQLELLQQIRARKKVVMAEHRLKKSTANNKAVLPRRADPTRASTTENMKASCLNCRRVRYVITLLGLADYP